MLIDLKVRPNQRFNRIEKNGSEWLELKTPATDGKANQNLVKYFSAILGISKSSVVLKKGHASRMKFVEINLDEKTLFTRLESSINKTM